MRRPPTQMRAVRTWLPIQGLELANLYLVRRGTSAVRPRRLDGVGETEERLVVGRHQARVCTTAG